MKLVVATLTVLVGLVLTGCDCRHYKYDTECWFLEEVEGLDPLVSFDH